MQYMKLQVSESQSTQWRVATCRARGAAVSITMHMAKEESRGRLVGAKVWTDGQWRAVAGVGSADVKEAISAGLCWWDGDDLVSRLYDHRGQQELDVKRAAGEFGKQGGRPPKNPKGIPQGMAEGSPQEPPVPVPVPVPVEERAPSPPPRGAASAPPPPESSVETRAGAREPAAASASPPPDGGAPGGADPRRIASSAVDVQALDAALKGDEPGQAVVGVARAFACKTTGEERLADWRREADGLRPLEVAAILAWRLRERAPVREASGFMHARKAWRELPKEDRRRIAIYLLRPLGVDVSLLLPKPKDEADAAVATAVADQIGSVAARRTIDLTAEERAARERHSMARHRELP